MGGEDKISDGGAGEADGGGHVLVMEKKSSLMTEAFHPSSWMAVLSATTTAQLLASFWRWREYVACSIQ